MSLKPFLDVHTYCLVLELLLYGSLLLLCKPFHLFFWLLASRAIKTLR